MLQLLLAAVVWANAPGPEPVILKADGTSQVSLQESLSGLSPGSVVVIGEMHGNAAHQNYQMQILKQLRSQGLKVSVGMEFVDYTHQDLLQNYREGTLAESDFLTKINWGNAFPFEFYRDQILFPDPQQSQTVALNLPRSISRQISKGGPSSLSPEQSALLPPNLERGNEGYFRRFKEAMGGHFPNDQAAENYFLAQCSWDDTMAWRTNEFLKQNPDQVLVIIVGEFHVQYGGGLPDRLRKLGLSQILTVSLINLSGLSPSEKELAVLPSTQDGPRADFLWISEF